jgi:hypothetical protein
MVQRSVEAPGRTPDEWKAKWLAKPIFSTGTRSAAFAEDRHLHRRSTTNRRGLSSQINNDRRAWNSLLARTAIDRRAPTKRCWPSFVASPGHVEPMPRDFHRLKDIVGSVDQSFPGLPQKMHGQRLWANEGGVWARVGAINVNQPESTRAETHLCKRNAETGLLVGSLVNARLPRHGG